MQNSTDTCPNTLPHIRRIRRRRPVFLPYGTLENQPPQESAGPLFRVPINNYKNFVNTLKSSYNQIQSMQKSLEKASLILKEGSQKAKSKQVSIKSSTKIKSSKTSVEKVEEIVCYKDKDGYYFPQSFLQTTEDLLQRTMQIAEEIHTSLEKTKQITQKISENTETILEKTAPDFYSSPIDLEEIPDKTESTEDSVITNTNLTAINTQSYTTDSNKQSQPLSKRNIFSKILDTIQSAFEKLIPEFIKNLFVRNPVSGNTPPSSIIQIQTTKNSSSGIELKNLPKVEERNPYNTATTPCHNGTFKR